MEIILDLNPNQLTIRILKKRMPIDTEVAKYYHDLSNVLIMTIDKILKRNRLDLKAVKRYKILSNLGPDSTSHKIAQAFIEGLKI
ncbi:MAG TPA: hypothetical protein VJH71_02150 [Candidatus Paceibacterota bacterium]